MGERQTGQWMNGVSVSFLSTGEEGQVLRSDYGGQSPRNSPSIPMSQPIESSPTSTQVPLLVPYWALISCSTMEGTTHSLVPAICLDLALPFRGAELTFSGRMTPSDLRSAFFPCLCPLHGTRGNKAGVSPGLTLPRVDNSRGSPQVYEERTRLGNPWPHL